MLARTIAWFCLFVMMLSGVYAEESKPNVVVILSQGGKGAKNAIYPVFDTHVLLGGGKQTGAIWRGYRWDSRVSPGKAASLSAMLYGRGPLLSGVVSDFDWRRKPVMAESLAELYGKAGYHTAYAGVWGMGLDIGHHPLRLGFNDFYQESTGLLNDLCGWSPDDQLKKSEIIESLVKTLNGERPVLLLINPCCNTTAKAIREQSEILYKSSKRETVLVIVSTKHETRGSATGAGLHHYPADFYVYHFGEMDGFLAERNQLRRAKTDWEMGKVLMNRLSGTELDQPQFRFFHQANWPYNESPEKHRHRGSLVVGKGYALVDGLELYPSTKTLEPDLTKPLDITKHQKIHSEMLAAHAQWWQDARKALHDPRAVPVGANDKMTEILSAMDWRPSKIIHADGSVPSSKPVLYQKDLLAMLKGLQNEKYRQEFPAYSGSWSVNVTRPGRYKITARLLPREADNMEAKVLAKLRGGQAFFRLGRNKVQLNLLKGASAVSVLVDADAGVTDLECWFTGQLALERELGAFFVEIQRVGDKKFDLKATEQPGTGQ